MTKQLRKEIEDKNKTLEIAIKEITRLRKKIDDSKVMFQPTKEFCDKCKEQALKSQREDFVKIIDEADDEDSEDIILFKKELKKQLNLNDKKSEQGDGK